MSLLHQPLERKLTALIGAEVSFEKVKMSLLGGWIEAWGVSIAGNLSTTPLFTARRIRAEISVRHALAKQFVVKSLVLEQPIFNIVLHATGGNNFPERPAETPPTADDEESSDGASSSNWSFAAQRVTITDGQIHLHDATARGMYHASIEPITAEFRQQGEQAQLSLEGASIVRRDEVLEWGRIKLNGTCNTRRVCFSRTVTGASQPKITGLLKQTLHWLIDAQLQATLELGGGIKLEIHPPALAEQSATFKLEGPLDLAELAAVLPPSVKLPQFFTDGHITGQGNVCIEGAISEDALRISQCTIRLSEVSAKAHG